MRLWSLHPKYLDRQGLVALWREALLAQAVLAGKTRGYRSHPQLDRFRAHPDPLAAIGRYLAEVRAEAVARGYSFDASRIGDSTRRVSLTVTDGQLDHEWAHLSSKLRARSPSLHRTSRAIDRPEAHPMFRVERGAVEPWERTARAGSARSRRDRAKIRSSDP